MDDRSCSLQDAAGRVERCPGAPCPFWEDGACAIERLGLDLRRRPDVVEALLRIRLDLDRARTPQADEARSLFFRLRPG